MMEFLWHMALGDQVILYKSDKDSKKIYALIGALTLLIWSIMIISIAGVFMILFGGFLSGLVISGIVSFLIITIYRLTLLTLEPNMLPHNDGSKGVFTAFIIRMSFILIFSFYVSSCALILINVFLKGASKSDKLIYLLTSMRDEHPVAFILMYIFMAALFLMPMIIKWGLRKKGEYFSQKGIIERKIIKQHYASFKDHYSTTFQKKLELDITIIEKYQDPPFNTIRIKSTENLKGQDDFMKLFFED